MRFGLLYEAQRPFEGTSVVFGQHVIPACRAETGAKPVPASA